MFSLGTINDQRPLTGISDFAQFLADRTPLLPPSTTNFAAEQAPATSAESLRLILARLTSPACCRVIDFSDTAAPLLPYA